MYRLIGSKDELLASIMQSFGEKVAMGWTNVLRSDSSPIEKLDGLSWVNTNVLDRFGDEFRIQLAWMRQSPPDTPNPGWLFAKRVRQMKSLLAEGIRSGEIKIDSPSNEILARSVIGVGWIPENILHDLGTRRVAHSRTRHDGARSRRPRLARHYDLPSAVANHRARKGSIARLTSSIRGPVAPLQYAHSVVPSSRSDFTSSTMPLASSLATSASTSSDQLAEVVDARIGRSPYRVGYRLQ